MTMTKTMTDAAVFETLRRVPLFSDIPLVELQEVAKRSQGILKKSTARVFEEGSPADSCFVLTSGRAKVVLSGRADSEVILGIVEPLALIGELALLDNSTRSAGLVAVDDCHFIRITQASFRGLRNNSAFEAKLVAQVATTLRRANDQIRAIYTFDSKERVVWCLARLASQRGRRLGGEIVISPKPLHQELAEMTGCSRETVSRVLSRLRRLKWVNWDVDALRLQANAFSRYLLDVTMAVDI